MPLYIGDQLLPAPTLEVVDWLENNLDPSRFVPWLTRSWPGFGSVGIAFPIGYRVPPPFRINRLRWPVGASRWAYGHFLAHADQINGADGETGIHESAYGRTGNEMNQLDIQMSSPDDQGTVHETLTAQMYVLAITPLARVLPPGQSAPNWANAMYLVTVVDQRYFWWQYAAPDFGINETAGKTWANVFTAIGTALNVTVNVDDINAAYLQPSRALNLTYEALPPIFDAAAYNVGHRVVVLYGGTVTTQTFKSALQTRSQDFQQQTWRTVRAGGDRFSGAY